MLDAQKEFEKIKNYIVLSEMHFRIMKIYVNSEFNGKLKDYPSFYTSDYNAHMIAFVSYLGIIFDTARGSINLKSLVRKIEKYKEKYENFREIKNSYEKVSEYAERVRKLRNEITSHRNPDSDYKEIFKKLNWSLCSVEEMFNDLFELSNSISVNFDSKPIIRNIYPSEELKSILRSVPSR